jgi:UPF0716 protein FxsA
MRAGAAAGFFWRKPMLFLLIFCFTVLPVLELMLLIELGRAIGTWPPILLVLGTGVAGAFFAKTQGLFLFQRILEELRRGNMPAREMISGLCVLLGGILLLTPGLLTDLTGIILLLPPTQRLVVGLVRRWLAAKINSTGFYFRYYGPEDPGSGPWEDDRW